jgi:maleylacetoacetate isomerase
MIVHGYSQSSAAYRLRIALNLKGLGHESRSVHLRRGDQKAAGFRAVNPQGLVPALEAEGLVLTQSLAIVEWLDERWPEPPLLPADRDVRARARAFALAIACDIHPLQNLRVLRHLKHQLGQEQAGLDTWCRHWIGEGLGACEALLSREPEAAFGFGDRPGIAEICLVPQMFSADRFGLDTAPFPRLGRLREACEALPAFADAHPTKQPDTPAA